MQEKRKSERLKELSDIHTTVLTTENHIPKGEICYNYSEDISVSGARIRGNVHLPVNTLLKIDFTLKKLKQKVIGWIENIGSWKNWSDYRSECERIESQGLFKIIEKITEYNKMYM